MNLVKGYLCVVAAAIMWASSGTAGKGLFEQGITPFELVQIRVTFSSVLIATFFGIFSKGLFRIRVKDLGYFLLLGGVGMTLVQGTYFYTISKIQVAAAILIQYLAPVFVAFYAICFWKERLTTAKLSSIIFAVGGCYLVVGGYNLQLLQMNRLGIMGGLCLMLCWIHVVGRTGNAPLPPLDHAFLLHGICCPGLAYFLPPFSLCDRWI
jgi:drug/metabolite transporter (DMT)-like permease